MDGDPFQGLVVILSPAKGIEDVYKQRRCDEKRSLPAPVELLK
jgi:hypothetical protein